MKHIIDTDELEKVLNKYEGTNGWASALCDDLRALIASPQADANTPPDVYDIAVDTGDGIYHTAEVVHFQQSGSKRMIQVRFGDSSPKADDYGQDFDLEYTCRRIRRLLNVMGMNDPSDGKDYVLMGMLFTLLGTICTKLEKQKADDLVNDAERLSTMNSKEHMTYQDTVVLDAKKAGFNVDYISGLIHVDCDYQAEWDITTDLYDFSKLREERIRQEQAKEVEALKHDLYSYMEAANGYTNEIMEQAKVIAELVDALEHLNKMQIVEQEEIIAKALAKVKEK